MTFGQKLKELREKAGLSQAGLHRASGLSLSAIHDYEQGKREPSLRNGFRLARALGVDVNVFARCEEASPRKLLANRQRPHKPAAKGKRRRGE